MGGAQKISRRDTFAKLRRYVGTRRSIPDQKKGLIVKRLLLAAALAALSVPALAAPLSYKITKTIPLGGPDRWDYVMFDPDLGRVYVAHGSEISVVDGKSGAIIGTVDGMPGGTHGIAWVDTLNKGYTDDGKAGEAVAFDLKTLKVTKRIKAEPDADGIVYDAPSKHVLVIDGDSGKVTVIDPKTDDVVATIDGGGGLEFGASGDNGKFYVNGAENNEIVRMDTRTNTADAHWPLTGCKRPHGLALDHDSMRLFASCSNKVMIVMDADNGKILATLPIGTGTDFATFDSVRGLAFSSNFDGTLSVVRETSPKNFVALPSVPTELGARTMAVDPKTGRLYLVTADFTVNDNVPASDMRHRYTIKPGSVKLLFLDPTP